jgi:hypothetical protein
MTNENDNKNKKLQNVQLLEDRGETSRFIHAGINENGDFAMYTYDIGKTPKECFGESEYEYWVTVQNEQKDKLLLALIEKVYKGNFSAVDDFRTFLQSHEIPSEFRNWS